jgi:hypothetical protein
MSELLPYQTAEIRFLAEEAIAHLPEEYGATLRQLLWQVFQMWKLDHGDRRPVIGLSQAKKTQNALVNLTLAVSAVDFEKAEPYQCAGPSVLNNIDLAFRLWKEKYGPFMSAARTASIPQVFAVITLHELDGSIEADSLLRVQDLLQTFEKVGLEAQIARLSPQAAIGKKFTEGRKTNTGGPIRKAIARELKRTPGIKNAALWGALAAKPPRGWQFFDNRHGKYIEGAEADQGMEYRRFCTVASEERKKLQQ